MCVYVRVDICAKYYLKFKIFFNEKGRGKISLYSKCKNRIYTGILNRVIRIKKKKNKKENREKYFIRKLK